MATSRKPKPQPNTLHELARITFNTPTGKQTLALLKRLYVETRGFDKDPFKTAYMAGERGLVLLLDHYTNSPILEEVDEDARDISDEYDSE